MIFIHLIFKNTYPKVGIQSYHFVVITKGVRIRYIWSQIRFKYIGFMYLEKGVN